MVERCWGEFKEAENGKGVKKSTSGEDVQEKSEMFRRNENSF